MKDKIALSKPNLNSGTSFTSIKRYFLLNIINTFPDRKNLLLLALDNYYANLKLRAKNVL